MNIFSFIIFATSLFFVESKNLRSNNEGKICNNLALSGGGSFGMVEVGILSDLYDKGKIPYSFDVITGISAGGLNTGFLSYYNNISIGVKDLYQVYKNMNNDKVYERELLKIMSEWSIYNTAPLYKTLGTIIGSKKPINNGPIALIGASNVLKEKIDIFRFDELNVEDKVDVLMSTSAIPLVFPPHKFNGSLYVDGGVITNELIYESLGYNDCTYYNILFISALNHKDNSNKVDGLFSYISSVLHLIYSTFDYQLSELSKNKCNNPLGVINACFPNSEELNGYSILDFNNGEQLYNISKNNYYCINFDLC